MQNEKIKIGADLNAQQLDALKSVSPTGDQILEHLDSLNEEIDETTQGEKTLPQTQKMKKSRPDQKNLASNVTTKAKKRLNRKRNNSMNDLDSELAQMEKELDNQKNTTTQTQQPEPEANTPEDAMKNQILDALKKLKNSPSQAQINAWKEARGANSVYVMAFSESDVYIYSFLTRGQHQKIQEIVKKAQETGNVNIENMLKEKVVQNCVLWPRPLPVEFFYNSRAGVVDGLYEAIMIQSGFLSPQQLMLLTTQL